jgi:sulfur-oxidizing protein SoxB
MERHGMINKLSRRTLLKSIGCAATGSLANPFVYSMAAEIESTFNKNIYEIPMAGKVRLLHTTDIHAQLHPVYFREPNVNLGLGATSGKLPHVVGTNLTKKLAVTNDSLEAYAYTCVNFEENALNYGKMGGVSNIKTLFNKFRSQAGGIGNTLTLDGGDLWQGSATSLWTRGRDMVEVSNLLGIQLMTGHWEFTYTESEFLSNINHFNGEFIGHNVRIKEDSLFGEEYYELVKTYGGAGLFDEDTSHAFRPYAIKSVAGEKIAVIGQAFPRTANANPPGFIPDWSFGIRENELTALVREIKETHSPAAVILLSHNGMDVDLKLASQVSGIDVILGGHTHDGIPLPIHVTNPEGENCLVTNAGSNGKFIGVMDMDIHNGELKGIKYQMAPVLDELIEDAPEMTSYLQNLARRVYDENIVESRSKTYHYNKDRIGKTFSQILNEKLAIAPDLLYRRGNFMGSWDQLICSALAHEYSSDISFSPGFRWGTSLLTGQWITMGDVMNQCAVTYGETYLQEMTGKQVLDILEQVADNLFEPDSYLQSGGDMVRVGGLKYTISPENKLGERISDVIIIGSNQVLAPKDVYKVSGWAVVGDYPSGRLIWDIIRDYILSYKNSENILPLGPINHPTIKGVVANKGIYSYQGELI